MTARTTAAPEPDAGSPPPVGLTGMIGHSAVYWGGVMVSKLIGFLLIPIYTHHLTPADYGTLELVALTTDVMALIIGGRLVAAMFRFYHAAADAAERRQVLATSLTAMLIVGLLFFIVASFFTGDIARLLFGSSEHATLLQIVFFTTALELVQQIAMSELRIHERSRLFVAITWIHLLLMLVGSILFLVVFDWGVFGVLLAAAIATGVVGPIVIVSVARRTGLGLHPVLLQRMVVYSLPLIPAALFLFVLHFADRYILNMFVSLEAVGLYALAYKFGFLISAVIAHPFSLIWGNRMHVLYRETGRDRMYNQVLSAYGIVLVGAGVGLSLFIDEVLALISPPVYHAAASLVPIIAAGYVLAAMNQLSMGPLYAESRTGWVALATAAGAGVNVVVNFLLVPFYGATGAAVATLIAFTAMAGVTQYLAARASTLRWDYHRAFAPLAVGVVIVVIGRSSDHGSIVMAIGFKLLLLLVVYPLALLLVRAVPVADLAEFWRWLRRSAVSAT
ncbi:lipopolysaccharide biosynthesis protein [Halofilum ochraceum]|uniref:lipopolysaccharide biosynthesis protein n=1 Tax=Halofilum ochraceum TaxID=1611323 RepID=UPI0009F60C87|nr:polysaccharide biosynthesis C-terminal domain-containing protein [Halofilum ochraceum]